MSTKKFDCYASKKSFVGPRKLFLPNHFFHAAKQFYRDNKFVLYSYRGIAFSVEISEEDLNRNPTLKILLKFYSIDFLNNRGLNNIQFFNFDKSHELDTFLMYHIPLIKHVVHITIKYYGWTNELNFWIIWIELRILSTQPYLFLGLTQSASSRSSLFATKKILRHLKATLHSEPGAEQNESIWRIMLERRRRRLKLFLK